MKVIHTHPKLCIDSVFKKEDDVITCSTDINKVTCQTCYYWYYHPEAKRLEQENNKKI